MDLHLTLSGAGHLERQLHAELKRAVLEGRLLPGERLPPSRTLADRLNVARNTVIHAYQQLIAEGFLEARVGAGTFVREHLREAPKRRAPAVSPIEPREFFQQPAGEDPQTEGSSGSIPDSADSAGKPRPRFDFQVGVPDQSLFPWDLWRPLVAGQLHGKRWRPGYPSPDGDPRARQAIARQIGLSRSVRAGPDDVLITQGAQQALDLIARTLLDPGDTVAIEDPGYAQARRIFAAHGATVLPVPVDGEGLDVAQLPRTARLVYVTPSHQFPLGMPMSLSRRLALLDWAERHRAAIIEDDYDSEFRFDGRPLEPLQSLDRAGRVLYVGSFSKSLLPSLRLGFLVAPASLIPSLRRAKALSDAHSPLETQRALAEFLDDGLFTRHVRRMLKIYRERRDRLLAALRRETPRLLEPLPSRAGLHLAVRLHTGRRFSLDQLWKDLAAQNVVVQPLTPYAQRPTAPGFALGYGAIATAQIDEGLERLARTVKRLDQRTRRQLS